MNATDPHGDRIIASVTGGASARRKQAFNLGVDPNTSFPPLADQLKRVATADAVGATSANVGMSFVAGPAAIGARYCKRAIPPLPLFGTKQTSSPR